MRIKLDRTVCDGFGICARHAPGVFTLDDWGYPSLAAGGDIAPEDEVGVRRALLDCPAHAIVHLGERIALPAGGEAGVARAIRSGQVAGPSEGTGGRP
ncbi:ferredoxin [Streptomyces sp. NPDC052052]|uniref:ferredoxin n=1 Tax=Streptomyces sp. NPDC052052 TaxID=3154756 RepID=UPI00343BCA79